MIIPPPSAKGQPIGPVLAELLTDERFSDRQVLNPNLRSKEEVYQVKWPWQVEASVEAELVGDGDHAVLRIEVHGRVRIAGDGAGHAQIDAFVGAIVAIAGGIERGRRDVLTEPPVCQRRVAEHLGLVARPVRIATWRQLALFHAGDEGAGRDR